MNEAQPPIPLATLTDVAAIDATVKELYAAISFVEGEPNWNLLRSLFSPAGQMIHVKINSIEAMSVETFISRMAEQIQTGKLRGFYEVEISRRLELFGNIAHVFSTFDARYKADDPAPLARGINSIQLLKNGDRWLVISLLWDEERSDRPIPAEYLPEGIA